jgi:succinate dehydrogenase/fumarate reductase flavoprotein subunit
VLAGNEPIYVDIRHLPAESLDNFVRTLGVDRYTLPGYFRQRHLDIRRELLPIGLSEMSIRRGGSYFRGSGLVVDTSGESNITGLFAGGDCSMVSGGISAAAAMGAIAGRGAVERVMVTTDVVLDETSVEDALARMEQPLVAEGDGGWKDFEDQVRHIVTDFVGMRRADRGMRHGLARLRELASHEPDLGADSFHALMRTLESKNIRQAAEIMTEAALHRTESRSGAAHRRLDFPETDDVSWKKAIIVRRDPDGGTRIDYLIEGGPVETAGSVAR